MTVLVAAFTSLITSFLVGRFYLNLQYHKSNAGFRQRRIIEATNYLVKEFHENGSITKATHLRFNYALSKVIEQLIYVYGIHPAKSQKDDFPLFQLPNETGIEFFNNNVRSIMIDLNNNAFIGWMSWVPNVKKLTTLWELCFCLEKIVTTVEFLKEKDVQLNNVGIIQTSGRKLHIIYDLEFHSEITELKVNYSIIEGLWFKWLSLNGITNT